MENPFDSTTSTILVQKALSAIKRANEQVDIATTVEILRGVRSQKVRENKYNELKTFGVGRDVSVYAWLNYIDQMLNCGYLETDRFAEKLAITKEGNEVLTGKGIALLMPLNYEIPQNVITLYNAKGVITLEDIVFQDLLLYKRLKGLCRSYAKISRKDIYRILKESTIQSLMREKPLSLNDVLSIGELSGKKVRFLCTIINTIRRHFDLDDIKIEPENPEESKRTRPQKRIRSRNTISVNKQRFEIDGTIKDCIHWSGVSAEIRSQIRWNLWQDSLIPVKQLIPENTPNREAVVKRFIEILKEGYNLQVKGEMILIPRRVEYDCDGKPVHTLLRESFEDALQQFESFLASNQHYPFAESSEYETSLRRWYQEMERGIIYVTPEQKALFDAVVEKYSTLPKIKPTTQS